MKVVLAQGRIIVDSGDSNQRSNFKTGLPKLKQTVFNLFTKYFHKSKTKHFFKSLEGKLWLSAKKLRRDDHPRVV